MRPELSQLMMTYPSRSRSQLRMTASNRLFKPKGVIFTIKSSASTLSKAPETSDKHTPTLPPSLKAATQETHNIETRLLHNASCDVQIEQPRKLHSRKVTRRKRRKTTERLLRSKRSGALPCNCAGCSLSCVYETPSASEPSKR